MFPPTAIEVRNLTKSFRTIKAVDDLSFTVPPGRITGFLGPNGAGKTTTLRCLVGLVRPSAGSATINGQAYRDLDRPTHTVGAALEASGFHPGRTGRDHLVTRTAALGLPAARADELLEFLGLRDAARRRAGEYSLGMRQRLALATALVGDPAVLVLDEPANGLDPAGIAWLRGLLRSLAAEGRTILVSSHLLAEIRQTVDDVVIIDKGRLLRSGTLVDVLGDAGVLVSGPDLAPLLAAATAAGATVTAEPDGDALISGLTAAVVGHLAWEHHVELHGLSAQEDRLENVFLRLTGAAS